jgi:hypothetical protein
LQVITTHTPNKNGCLQTINTLYAVSCAPSPMGTPFFVTLSKTWSSAVIITTF